LAKHANPRPWPRTQRCFSRKTSYGAVHEENSAGNKLLWKWFKKANGKPKDKPDSKELQEWHSNRK